MIQEELKMDDYSEGAATFGDRLALARESQDLTQEQLAKRLGLRVQTIQNWEFDRSEPRANRLQMVAGFLNVSMIWLLTGEGGSPVLRGEGAAAVSAELSGLLGEIREIRLSNIKANDRLAKLEKRLRGMSEVA
jgi:transcriptional regulator with XRE-family HTH domain